MSNVLKNALSFTVLLFGVVGCSDTSTTTRETTVKTPGGTTTTTETRQVEQTGENPPPAQR
jgi:hypothetical protein